MQSDHLITFMTIYALVWAFGATLAMLHLGKSQTWHSMVYAGISLTVLAGVVWIDSKVSLGRNAAVHLFRVLWNGDPHQLVAAAFGFSLGFGPAVWSWQAEWGRPGEGLWSKLRKAAGILAILLSFLFATLFIARNTTITYWKRIGLGNLIANQRGYFTRPGFTLKEYHSCQFRPIQIAIGPDGALYACSRDNDGVVFRLAENPETGRLAETVIAKDLDRPHGLAFYRGDLYVSRSGHYMRAQFGSITEVNTGAVTLLRDIDGDGMMDYFHDVLADLPGAQDPDTVHQNNGIAFGPDGYLYTTVGAHSNWAPTLGEFEGTILRSRADGSELRVFARGLRNPFDLVVGPDGELFCTDNDIGYNAGDELNHVVAGGHYGYPYADGSMPTPEGTIGPILVNQKSTFQGIAYTDSPELPDEYRNCLYVVHYPTGEISQVRLDREGNTYRARSTLFAGRFPEALDIAIDQNGTFYVSCYESKKIYRLRYRREGG